MTNEYNPDGKEIRFIDSHYKDLFHIPDGSCVQIHYPDEMVVKPCTFIDEYHTQIGYNVFHICQFAEIMERNGASYMVEVQALQQHIKNYRNTRQIYIEYRKSGYSKKFFEEHRQEITIHKAAKQAFDELQITKLPSMQSLYEEFHQLAVQKKQDYAEYRQIRKEKEELLIAKRTVETILNIDRQKEQEKEKEKEEKKNFR